MRFSDIIVVYFIMGAVMLGAGVLPWSQVNPIKPLISVDNGTVHGKESAVQTGNQSGNGILDNLIAPMRQALSTVAGGAGLAVYQAVTRFFSLIFWPVATMNYIGAPEIVVILSGAFSFTFLFAILRIIRYSI